VVSRSASADLVSWDEDKPEPVVPVPVAGRVPVPVRRPAVAGVVVPTAAPNHPGRASGQNPKSFNDAMTHCVIKICSAQGQAPAPPRLFLISLSGTDLAVILSYH